MDDELIDDGFEGLDEPINQDEQTPLENDFIEPEASLEEEPQESLDYENSDSDIIQELLKSKGIQDSSKIKFENDNGEIEEINWNDLSLEDRLEILRNTDTSGSQNIDADELELLNAIRTSKMSPKEYINYVQQMGVDNYVKNSQSSEQHYSVDDISDDELYVMDLINKVGDENITDEELQEALDNAKSNATVYNKQIQAIRNEYKALEDANKQQEQLALQQQQQEQFNVFADSVKDSIINFNEFGGFDLNLSNDDREELYDLITGFDEAGNSIFGKVLNDTNTLVQMAWFALNGKQMIEDITDYFTSEITNVRKTSYQKGLEDGKKNKDSIVYRKPKNQSSKSSIVDLDDDWT